MAILTLTLVNFCGQELNRAGYMGTGNLQPPPPSFMSNGLIYGPMYFITGSLFSLQLSYTMNSVLDLGVGNDLFDIELFTNADQTYTPAKPIYSAGYGLYLNFKAIPANHGVMYQSDRTPEGFQMILTYQGSGNVPTTGSPQQGAVSSTST